ncbi:hypothetical protein [Streptomyces sp. TRM70350]|uniref:hypothetical protein n=1 Tax=Streptomyces sp. TRM70350 TaxID=2856165 RepID=UPI001C486972|nr:hypothetical protein [Streptomyces sp. TRM70350]MBV7698869.1 hypothetical protein [Streptomyces sp. TRM70350]
MRRHFDDSRFSRWISVWVSAFGLLPALLLAVVGVQEYRAGGSVLWAGAGGVLVLVAVWVLVRDVRALRAAGGDGSR